MKMNYIYIFLMFPLASKAPAGHRSWEKALGSMYCGSDGGGGGESIGLSFITENPYSLQAAALVYIYLFTGSRCVKQHRSVTHLRIDEESRIKLLYMHACAAGPIIRGQLAT
jgi:hypothetical protein